MAKYLAVLCSILMLRATSKAAPSETKNIEIPKLDTEPYGVAESINNENESDRNARQKRFYDYAGFGFSQFDYGDNYPFLSNPSYTKRDESKNTAVYGSENSLTYVLRRLQEIVGEARRQAQAPPSQTVIPAYIPIFYLPPINCVCSNSQTTAPTTPPINNNNINNQPTSTSTNTPQNEDTTMPDLTDRFKPPEPELNWGIVQSNNTANNFDDGNDGNRPISLDPVVPNVPLDVAVPPVEHGSEQAGAEPVEPPKALLPEADIEATEDVEPKRPNLCHAAVIKCCPRNPVTRNCFRNEGCPDPSFNGDPCDHRVYNEAINIVQAYIKARNAPRKTKT